MPRTKDIDQDTRERLRAWLMHYRERQRERFRTDAEFAAHLDIDPATLSTYLSGRRTVGFDTALKMHRRLGVSMDDLVDALPRQQEPSPPIPSDASRPTASPRKRHHGGGVR